VCVLTWGGRALAPNSRMPAPFFAVVTRIVAKERSPMSRIATVILYTLLAPIIVASALY
jgi:hypothetical protein